MRFNRLLPLMALAGVATSAHAFYIDIFSHGVYSLSPGLASVTEGVLFQDSGVPVPNLTTLNYAFTTGGPYVGTGIYTNGVDSLMFNFAYTSDVPISGNTENAHGTWTLTGGSGAFSGLTGTGVISSNFNANAGQKSLTTFSGDLEPLPEPASLAAIGVGAIGLLRLRRRR